MRLLEMIRKEYMILIRRKKFTFLILFLPFILGLIFSLLPGLLGFERVSIGICNFDDSPKTIEMLDSIQTTFQTEIFSNDDNCAEQMQISVRKNRNLIGVLIEQGFADDIENFQQANIFVYFDNTKFNLETYLSWFMDMALDDYKQDVLLEGETELKLKTETLNSLANTASDLVDSTENTVGIPLSPIKTQVDNFKDLTILLNNLDTKFLADPVSTTLVGVYPITSQLGIGFAIIFSVLSLFTSFMVGSTGVIYDRTTKYTTRLKTSKTFNIEYIISKVVVFLGISALQMVLLLMLFGLRGADFNFNFLGFLAATLLITTLNILIGMSIGLVSENETIAILISLIFTLPFLFLSGIFAPIELFPEAVQIIASLFPLGLEIELLKKVSILGESLSTIWIMVQSMLNYITAFLVLNIILLRNRS